jgi:hypothetical protein
VVRIVEAIKPQSIVFIGFDALRLFDRHPEPRRRNAAGRVLTRTGSVADRDAIATLHLSGARISGEDFDAIKEDMLSFLQQQGVAVEMSPNGLICTVAEVASAVATHSMLEASAAT